MLERIQETAAFLKGKMHTQPETAIILGTGLGSLAGEITEKYEIRYEEIPNLSSANWAIKTSWRCRDVSIFTRAIP